MPNPAMKETKEAVGVASAEIIEILMKSLGDSLPLIVNDALEKQGGIMQLISRAQEHASRAKGRILTLREYVEENHDLTAQQRKEILETGDSLVSAGVDLMAAGILQLGAFRVSNMIEKMNKEQEIH